tara:strand:+ start:563 stop:1024 length:462 start_codon:yes stop_codon:yes gene_type:complete
MGSYKDKNGTTKIGDFLRGAAPHILDVVGDVLPDKGALGIIKNLISKDDKLTPSQKVEALELIKIDLENTKDARDLQKVALQQDDLFSKRFVYYLAIFWSVISSCYFFLATFTEVVNEEMADIILGFLLGTVAGSIINFFFGSSSGSKEKDKR